MSVLAAGLVAQLVGELEQLPASRAAALQVVRLVDDPGASAAQVAGAAAADPALTARVLRLANSAYYGLSGRVATPSFAITVVGFTTVRSLAAVAAAGLAAPDALPPGFWGRAAAAARGASLLARRVGAGEPEAFCVGLLHDLGTALLRRHDRFGHDALVAAAPPGGLVRAERAAYGGTHASLCAEVLASWSFPDELCSAIAGHHEPAHPAEPPLHRALKAGLALAEHGPEGPTPDQQAALTAARVPRAELPELLQQVEHARVELASALRA